MENRASHFYLPAVLMFHGFSLSFSLTGEKKKKKEKTAKLNAFPEADGNRVRCSNPISTNLSRGKDKCVLLCGTVWIYSPENIPYTSRFKRVPFIPLY